MQIKDKVFKQIKYFEMDLKELNHQSKQPSFCSQRRVVITSVLMKVKFACRLFMQYPLNKSIRRTRQLKVDSKKQSYEYNQIIIWNRQIQHPTIKESNDLKITVKLLSNKGFEFTAGSFVLQEKDFTHNNFAFSYKIAKTSDVDAQCFCEILEPDSTLQQKHFLKQIKEDIQQNSKSDNEQQLNYNIRRQESNAILPEYSKVQQKLNVDQTKMLKIDRLSDIRAYTSNKSNKSQSNKIKSQQYGSQSFFQSRYRTLEKQLDYHGQLFEKQKTMINLIEGKYKQSIHQQQKLKANLSKYETQLQEKRKIIYGLESEKINLLANHLKNQKRLSQFKQSMRVILEKILGQIAKTFSKKQPKQQQSLGFKLTNSVTKNNLLDPKTPVQILKADAAELQSEALSQSYNFPDLSDVNQLCSDNIIKNNSDVLSKSANLSKNAIESKSNSPPANEARIKIQKQKKDKFDIQTKMQFDDCLQTLKYYKTKIIQKVAQNANKISNKLTELGQSNKIFKLKLKQNREEFQNNQQALFEHLEQLEQGLERQLQITEQKDQAIFGYMTMIEDLTEKIQQLSSKIAELQELNNKLQQQKIYIKGQLHQNNYMFSLKQEDYMKRIHILQHSTSLMSNNKHFAHLTMNKQENISSEYSDRDNDDYQSSLNEYCQRLRDKQIELIREKKQKQNLMEQLSSKQQQLQFAIMSKKKLQFAIKLKQKLANQELHRSFDLGQDQQQQKKIHMEQQFLKVLI